MMPQSSESYREKLCRSSPKTVHSSPNSGEWKNRQPQVRDRAKKRSQKAGEKRFFLKIMVNFAVNVADCQHLPF
jgi:hypothetical protein